MSTLCGWAWSSKPKWLPFNYWEWHLILVVESRSNPVHSIASIECVCRDGESCACAHVDVRRLTHAGSNSNRRSLSVYVHTYTCKYVAIDIAAAVNLGVRLSFAQWRLSSGVILVLSVKTLGRDHRWDYRANSKNLQDTMTTPRCDTALYQVVCRRPWWVCCRGPW